MAVFGIFFVLLAIGGAAYNVYNVAARHRLSSFDVSAGQEHVDSSDTTGTHNGRDAQDESRHDEPDQSACRVEHDHCPSCGGTVREDFDYCPQCGKET